MGRKFFLFFFFLGMVSYATAATLYVLCYHTFSSNIFSSYNFQPEIFRSHLETLLRAGYRFVCWEEVLLTNLNGDHNILITIDDANISIKNVEPILDEFGIKPILFVYPAIIGRVSYALTWDDIQRLKRKGWTIGAHGYYHLYLDQKLYESDRLSFLREIQLSKRILEKKLNISIDLFGYPFGVYAPITIEVLKKENYAYAFTIAGKPTRWPPGDPYQIPRYLMTSQMWRYLVRVLVEKKMLVSKE